MITIDSVTITNGQTVKFQSKAANDNNIYTGRVLAIAEATVARIYTDIHAGHSNVVSVDDTILPVDDATYLLISVDDGAGGYTYAFAADWIQSGTLSVVTGNKTGVVELIGLAGQAEADAAIAHLVAGGFNARLTDLY